MLDILFDFRTFARVSTLSGTAASRRKGVATEENVGTAAPQTETVAAATAQHIKAANGAEKFA